MDSSRLLLSLMTLCRQGDQARRPEHRDSLDGLISRTILRSLLSALHYRDVKTISHVRRVAQFTSMIAKQLGWEDRSLKVLEIASLLHDIGKIGIPDSILNKPGKFSPDEVELMSLHNKMAMDILQACRVHKDVIKIVNQAHELRNGISDGNEHYGQEYHQGARLLAVVDAYDSLTNDQIYRSSKTHEEAIRIMQGSATAHFDSSVIEFVDRHAVQIRDQMMPADLDGSQFAPLQPKDQNQANVICNIFCYLYFIESLYDGFSLLDADLRFVIWNEGAKDLFHIPEEHLVNQVWSSKILPYADQYANPLTEKDCPLNQVVMNGRASVMDMKLKTADNNWVDIELQTIPLNDHQNNLMGVAQIYRDRTRNRRSHQYRQLKLQASRDALTNVANRGELENQLAILMTHYQRDPTKSPFSVIFLDIDHFKSINDTYGHGVGDRVLIELANLLKKETYSGELVGRYGGEEFVILCPETDLQQAAKRAERIRESIEDMKISGIPQLKVTSSFGVTVSEPGDSISSLVRRADKGLYDSKDNGRNRVTCLTNSSLLQLSIDDSKEKVKVDPWVVERQFEARVPEDMIFVKLKGYMADSKAELKSVQKNLAELFVGTTTMWGGWGRTKNLQPVSIKIQFMPSQKADSKTHMSIKLTLTPRGRRPKDVELFKDRTKNLIIDFQSYFAVGDQFN
jgi:diguanylate cyclase (GGDEF)-like protein/putative nucleotidyltransferase with HDIG domain